MREERRKIVVGITGASGAIYAKRCLAWLSELAANGEVEFAVCASPTAPEVWALECGGDMREQIGERLWGVRDFKAPFASGSAGWDAMLVVPCSMGTVARIAHGISDSLLTRAADVMLKERRTLVVVPRETPLSLVHLENLTALARAGAVVLPAMPSFYSRPESIDALVDTVVGRIMDHLEVDAPRVRRGGEKT
jgi:4-hydroxy-3-polyprenylbenzoate decarboxylase